RKLRRSIWSPVSRAQRSTKWCAADPGSLQTPSLLRSRISGSSLRAAPHPGNSGGYRMTPALHALCCSFACAIDALAKASACLASTTAVSKSPAAAAFLAAARACSVGIHWFFSAPASCSAAAAAASAVLKSASVLAACATPAQSNQHVTAKDIRMRMVSAPPLWPRARPGDRQAVAHIGQIIFDVAVKLVLRLERHAAHLDVAGDQPPAHRAHAVPFRAIDRHRRDDAERRRQH